MPRDAPLQALGEIDLPGGRKGRVIETSRAGEFAIVTQSTEVDQLHQAGHLDRDQHDAAMRLQELFERSGVRPRLVGGAYDGATTVDNSSYDGRLLETLTVSEMAAWRALGRMLAMVPRQYRTVVSATVVWDMRCWNISSLQRGLRVLATALRRPRR